MTIYALSTGPGVSGIAIIRISGSETKKVLKSLPINRLIPLPVLGDVLPKKTPNTEIFY